jgi:hypothetical protein
MAEWLKAADCKSAHVSVRRFEPYSAHIYRLAEQLSCLANGSAEVAQLVER